MTCYRFHDDFALSDGHGHPPNWQIENHTSINTHKHARVRDGRFELYTPAQRYLPRTPALECFKLTLQGGFNARLSDTAVLRLLFHYHPTRQWGYGLELTWAAGQLDCMLAEVHRHRLEPLACKTLAPNSDFERGEVSLTLAVDRAHIRLEAGGGAVADFKHPGTLPHRIGALAIQKGSFPGPFLLDSVRLASNQPMRRDMLIEGLCVTFPNLNGQQVPYRFHLKVCKIEKLYDVTVTIAGGAFEKPDVPNFYYHGRVIDRLTRPYWRVGNRLEDVFHLHAETLVMANMEGRHFYEALYRRPAWPLEQRYVLDVFDLDAPLYLGYEHFSCSASRHCEGGPTEIAVDLRSGRIRESGRRVLRGECAMDLHSPSDKAICARLPRQDPRYAQALAFAQTNHFFLESEPCRFSVRVRQAIPDLQPDELTLRVRLLDAFREPAGQARDYPVPLPDRTAGEAMPQAVDVVPDGLGCLAPGVYHLDLRLMQGGFEREIQCKAFEVMPETPGSPSAPLLSGLPVLYSSATETMGLETDAFDPWAGPGIDACHYISIVSFFPEFARQARIWQVTRVYQREWFLWLTTRTTPRIGIEENADILAYCDYVNMAPDAQRYHLYLWKFNLYQGVVLEQLNVFLQAQGLKAIDEMTEKAFCEIVLPRWREWVDWFCRWLCRERLPAQNRQLRALNPSIRRSDYGPVNVYCSCYKSAHSMLIRGLDPHLDLETQYAGFFQYEDYPFAAGYAIHAKTYALASLKLENPRLRYYPEIYAGGGGGCPDSAVGYANPPFGAYRVPPLSVRKRVYESVYATVWHDRQGFAYWNDNGFHARNWSLPMYGQLLSAWKTARRITPCKPLRSTAFLFSRELCLAHPNVYRTQADSPYPGGDVCNPAEECVAFAYDVSRSAGLPAGFTAALDSLGRLDPSDVDLLVLPPLQAVPVPVLDRIRALHAAGVSLFGFARVDGLEDLFGVEPLAAPARMTAIRTGPDAPDALRSMAEYPDHPICESFYRATGTLVILKGDRDLPVLTCKRNSGGAGAALWNLPPTWVRREDFFERGLHGRETISPLVRRATDWVLRMLGKAPVHTTAGKLIAFRDTEGAVRIIVSEDAHPAPAFTIRPLVTIQMPGLSAERIQCDRDYAIVSLSPDALVLRLKLEPDECALITLDPTA